MRGLLLLIAFACAVTLVVFEFVLKTSYAAYSAADLDRIENEVNSREADGVTTVPLTLARKRAQTERQRRIVTPAMIGVGALALLGAAVLTLRGTRRSRKLTQEDRRLAAAIGDPAALLEGARAKAAALLCVSLDAPPAVIEAAYQAQIGAHDAQKLAGLAPALRLLVAEQREEFTKARDLLLRKPEAAADALRGTPLSSDEG